MITLPLCTLLAFAAASWPDRPATRDDRPSIVILLSDDAGWSDPGFMGSDEVPTPRLDALASEGTVFDACYVTASVCSPSRAGLLTGRQQQRFGHEYNLPGTAPRELGGLPLEERTIADRLRDAGYATGIVGKWHLGLDDRFLPTRRGFDEFHGLRAGARSYFGRPGLETGVRAWERMTTDESTTLEESEIDYVTDLVAEDAADFIARNADHPWFLLASFTAPHTPMHALEDDLSAIDATDMSARRHTYVAMWRSLDRACGRILDAAAATGRPTIVIFLNDNGGATNNGSDNGPWRGMKGSHFEGGLRVPAIWTRPGDRIGRFTDPISVLDLVATLLSSAEADTTGLDGVDLAPWLDGAGDPPAEAPRTTLQWRRGPVATMREGDLKLIRVEGAGSLLFDLARDPGETRDLSADRPTTVLEMLARLARWESEMTPARWTTGPTWRRNLLRKHSMDVVGREAERALP